MPDDFDRGARFYDEVQRDHRIDGTWNGEDIQVTFTATVFNEWTEIQNRDIDKVLVFGVTFAVSELPQKLLTAIYDRTDGDIDWVKPN
jgi:hypothetical protein